MTVLHSGLKSICPIQKLSFKIHLSKLLLIKGIKKGFKNYLIKIAFHHTSEQIDLKLTWIFQ